MSRALPRLNCDCALDRWFYSAVALVVVAAFFFANWCQFVPAHPGVDQNGYLFGGKALARTGTMKYAPLRPGSSEFDPHQFVGRMYVGADLGTPTERYYPKYPLGYPALVALALKLTPANVGPVVAYWINPVAMTLAVFATFLIGRLIANSFVAVLAAIAFATSPTSLLLSTNPNSHATAVCFVTWGIYMLLRWWQEGGRVRAIVAGLLIGYAATIRYTEGLLALPIGLVLLFNLRPRDRRSWIESGLLVLGWLIPVGILLTYNKAALGTWTGYDPTNESAGFRWEFAKDNWETMLRQLATTGLFWLFPLAIAGMIMMFWWNWKLAMIFASWIVPCIVTYTFYYWAPDGSQTGYLRFFETILPGLAVCAMWMLKTLAELFAGDQERQQRIWQYAIPVIAGAVCIAIIVKLTDSSIATAIWAGCLLAILVGAGLLGRAAGMTMMIGLFAGIAAAVQARGSIQQAEFEQFQRLMIYHNAQAVRSTAPQGSVIFSTDQNLFHHLQFTDDYYLYSGETFNRGYIQNLPNADPPDEPQGLDPGRRDALYRRFKDFTQKQLEDEQKKIITSALESSHRVFLILPRNPNDVPLMQKLLRRDAKGKLPPLPDPVRRFANEFDVDVVYTWTQPLPRPVPENLGKPRGQRFLAKFDRRFALSYEMVELKKKTPSTQPVIAPRGRGR